MKRSAAMVLFLGTLLLLLASGCGLPGANTPAGETAEGRAAGAQHPPVYEVRVSGPGTPGAYMKQVVWTGSEYGIVWESYTGYHELYFARLNKKGVKIGVPIKIVDEAEAYYDLCAPVLAWTGNGYGIAWVGWSNTNLAIFFAYIDQDGSRVIANTAITSINMIGDSISREISIVWKGNEFGIAWPDSKETGMVEIMFARIDDSGNKIGENQLISEKDDYFSIDPSLAWNGNGYGVAWTDFRSGHGEIYFAKITEDGVKDGLDTRISIADTYFSGGPSLVWGNSRYGIAWTDERLGNTEIYFTTIHQDGYKDGLDRKISINDEYDSRAPSAAWTGSGYGVVWEDLRDSDSDLYFVHVKEDGTKDGTENRLFSSDTYPSNFPSLAWTGTEYGVAWNNRRSDGSVIYFARFDSTGNKLARGGIVGTVYGALEGEYYIRNVSRGTYLTWDFATTTFALREYNYNWSPQAQRWKLLNNDTDEFLQLRNVAGSGPYLAGQYSGGTLSKTLVLSWSAPVGDEGLKSWKLSDGENDGQYYIVIKEGIDANPTYRLYGTSASVVELKTSTSSPKFWEIIPAGE